MYYNQMTVKWTVYMYLFTQKYKKYKYIKLKMKEIRCTNQNPHYN